MKEIKLTKGLHGRFPKDVLVSKLTKNPSDASLPLFLYATDDFNDFVCSVRDFKVIRNAKDPFDDGKTFDIIFCKCMKAVHNGDSRWKAKLLRQARTAKTLGDLVSELNGLERTDVRYQITSRIEKERIYFLATSFRIVKDIAKGIDRAAVLVGTFN